MPRVFLKGLVCILLFMQSAAFAVNVTHLSQATVNVPDRSSDALYAGLKTAFAQVLIKLSGNPQVMTLPVIQNAKPDLQQWVQSYAYTDTNNIVSTEKTEPAKLGLRVQFDREGITQLLREAGQSVWSSYRPMTLVYIDGDVDTWQTLIAKEARLRGLPLIFPEMDLDDQAIISEQPDEQIMGLSRRYGVSSVLILHIDNQDAHSVAMNSQYFLNGETTQWAVSGANQLAAVDHLLSRLTDAMMNQLVSNDDKALQKSITLSVAGVGNIADYANVMRYLRQKEDVVDVSVKDISASGMLLALHISGNVSHFQKLLARDGRLKVVNADLVKSARQADLYYYW